MAWKIRRPGDSSALFTSVTSWAAVSCNWLLDSNSRVCARRRVTCSNFKIPTTQTATEARRSSVTIATMGNEACASRLDRRRLMMTSP